MILNTTSRKEGFFMKKLLALALLCALVLTACGPKAPAPTVEPLPTEGPTTTPTAEPTPEPTPEAKTAVKLAVLPGPTGVGAAKLLHDNEAGTTNNDYTVTVAADNQQVTAGLLNGDFDIAALATNVASNLYHKSEGAIQIACVNTLGTLYILNKGIDDTLNSLADLKGRTIYAFGQGANPEYVLRYLLQKNGLDMDKDVTVVWQTLEEVTATMLTGEGELCMLPVPGATALSVKSEGNIQPVFDLSAEWDAVAEEDSRLAMGCIVVRTAFAQEHPEAVQAFLNEYAASIDYIRANADGPAAQMVADAGLVPSAAIAAKAIPQCNLIYLDGEDMRDTIQGYFAALFSIDPAAIGGSTPDDAFYFMDAVVE